MSVIRDLFLKYQAQTSSTPLMLEIEKAEGVYIWDTSGKQYLDLISGIAVSNVGHCAPEVVAATQQQAAKYMHTLVYGEHIHQPAARFAEKIATELGGELSVVYFVNSGAEAVEGALKTVKKYTGRHKIVAFKDAYHGSTSGALSVTGNDWIKDGYGPLLGGVTHIRFNEIEELDAITTETAAVIIEPIQGESGCKVANPLFWKALREKCNETGSLMIVDEIQTGFGRTGKMFAHTHYNNIQPDIVLLAKGMGGGMPIGAFVGKKEIMQVLSHDPILGHITTFGGHPVCCAAGLASLNKIIDERLLDTIPQKEKIIREILIHPKIVSLSGMGLMFAIELASFEQVLTVVEKAMQKGILTDWFLNKSHALRLAPPLIITNEQLKDSLTTLLSIINEAE